MITILKKNIQIIQSEYPRLNKANLMILLERIVSKQNLNKWIDNLLTEDLGKLVTMSHETSTHYKYFLFKDRSSGLSLWLHEYKSEKLRKKGYAEIPHYHRYDFASYIIRGGFEHFKYSVKRSTDRKQLSDMLVIEERKYCRGDIYGITAIRDIHCLENIEPNTLTLVLRGKSKKKFSESFDFSTKCINTHIPISVKRLERLINEIK